MKGKLHVLVGIAVVLMLAWDLYLWGGLTRAPDIGPLALEATRREVSLAAIYAPTGRAMLDVTGLTPRAAAEAAETFAPVRERLLANPPAAMETLIEDMPSSARISYYGAPALFLLFCLLWWRRPRGVHMMGRR